MRFPALAILAIGVVSATAPTQAQTYNTAYPVCMHVVGLGASYDDCSFVTLAQCQASAAGRAAQCNINPYYAGRGEFAAGDRRQRRSY